MFRLPFFRNVQKDINKFLSININANDVRVLNFYKDDQVYRVVGCGKQKLEAGSVRNGIVIEKEEVTEALNIACAQAVEETGATTREAIIGIDGGLCLGLTTTIRLKRYSPAPIQRREVEDLYDKLMEASYIQAKGKALYITGDPDTEIKSVNTSNIYTKIDNQLTTALEGNPGSIIELAQFNAFAPDFHLKSLQEIAKHADLNVLTIGSLTHALSEWIKDSPTRPSDFILIDIAEDSTDVAVTFGGGIVSTQSLHMGYNHFAEGLSEKMGLTTNEAHNVLRVYSQGKLSDSEAGVVKTCVSEILEIWISGLQLLFEEFFDIKTFASMVYVTGCGTEIPDIENSIKSEPWTKSIPFKIPPEFKKFSFSDLSRVSDSTGKIQTMDWLNTAASSIMFEQLFLKND